MVSEPSKKRTHLLRQVRQTGAVLKGSLVEVELTCGTPGCRCHKEGPKHKGLYFSYRHSGRSRTVYVPKAGQKDARKAHANWLKLKQLLEEVTAVELSRLGGSGKRGRAQTRKGGRK